ncbi:DUF4190 domain-containing protein [Promicromonospora panici]|uniref:DUF4190 domain-containing protein n=1 Tax=Promicromonospora panici TaxID=2219658 RepID=UPI00101D8487|nr:DUF4190 domain-containing protein [Promicromonospora panici]
MTQPDEWKSPYDPPKPSTPDATSGPVFDPGSAPTSASDQAGPPSPYQQPYEQPYQQPYLQQPAQGSEYQQGSAYGPGPHQPQPQPPQYGAPYGYAAPPEKNALGVWSLVLGILSVVMLFSCLVGFLAAIPAVITGHLSRKAHKEGLADNPGLALGGIITGWVTIGLTLLAAAGIAVLFSIPEFREGFFSETSSSY